MKTAETLFYSLLCGATLLIGSGAQAGAPGPDGDLPTYRITTLEPAAPKRELSPAEIRNAVSVRMDELAAQGIEVDRAAVDGIGLEREESYAEAVD